MPKFGELINLDVPILLDFFGDLDESSKTMHPVLRDVAAAIGDKGKVIKINILNWRGPLSFHYHA